MNKASSPLDLAITQCINRLHEARGSMSGDGLYKSADMESLRLVVTTLEAMRRELDSQAPAAPSNGGALTPAEAGRLVNAYASAHSDTILAATDTYYTPSDAAIAKSDAAAAAIITALTHQGQEELRWTREKPTRPGMYWFLEPSEKPIICDVTTTNNGAEVEFFGYGGCVMVSDMGDDCKWFGPIPEAPKEGREG